MFLILNVFKFEGKDIFFFELKIDLFFVDFILRVFDKREICIFYLLYKFNFFILFGIGFYVFYFNNI